MKRNRRRKKWLRTWSAILAVALVLLAIFHDRWFGLIVRAWRPVPTIADLYPKAPPMPPVVGITIEELLKAHEAFLREKVPAAMTALQSGLSDAEIDALEAKNGFKLSPDMRALYRWHDGTLRGREVDTFPDMKFISLEEAIGKRDALMREWKSRTPQQHDAINEYVGFSDQWLDVIVDPSGAGYFFDPGRKEVEGSFFFLDREDAGYIFFPALRNYLAGLVEGEKGKVFNEGALGEQTVDFLKATRYGTVTERIRRAGWRTKGKDVRSAGASMTVAFWYDAQGI